MVEALEDQLKRQLKLIEDRAGSLVHQFATMGADSMDIPVRQGGVNYRVTVEVEVDKTRKDRGVEITPVKPGRTQISHILTNEEIDVVVGSVKLLTKEQAFKRGVDPANDICLLCGKHIKYHYGMTEYRCFPRPVKSSEAPKERFKECQYCAAKPGSPVLCNFCQERPPRGIKAKQPTPTKVETALHTFRVKLACTCGGEMEATNVCLPLNPKYPHKCSECGKITEEEKVYPRIEYREKNYG